jgi:tape measure domain-containing protein
MANSFKQAQQEALALIREIETEVSKLDAQLIKTASNINKTLKNINGSANLQSQLAGFNTEMQRLNNIVSKQQSQIQKLTKAQSNYNNTNKADTKEIKSKIPTLRQLTKAQNSLTNAYTKLITEQRRARDEVRRLTVEQGKNATATIKAQRSYDRLTKKVNEANKATSNFSKTGLGNAVRGLKNLVMAFGVVGGVQLFANLARDVFELTKKLDGLNFAMRKIIPSNYEFQQTTQFLKQITNDFGTEIVSTTERYIKFLAAAKQSNLSLGNTEKIFGTVTKAAGVLGLKTDELTGVYLALEQMLSKGKVTTEELRRQLGERLPGAFGIMADAIGVSVSKLDEMLKKGEILSADALPKFADALEVAYGIESVEKVDTLVAAQNRLNNAWIEFVSDLDASKVFKDTLNFLAENLGKILNLAFKLTKGFLAYKAVVITLNTITRGYSFIVGTLAAAKIALSTATGRATATMKAFNFVTKANPIGALISVLGLATAAWVAFKDGVIETSQALKNMQKEMFETSKSIVENELKILDARTKLINDTYKNEKESKEKTLEMLDEYEEDVISGAIGLYSTQEELDETFRKNQEKKIPGRRKQNK